MVKGWGTVVEGMGREVKRRGMGNENYGKLGLWFGTVAGSKMKGVGKR